MKTTIKNSNYQIKNLLSSGYSNAKTKKNSSKTFILYLAPYTQNKLGFNLCPKASAGCSASCLFTAGRGKFSNVQSARINKANYFLEERENFINQLASEILKQYAKAKRERYKVLFRLNGTTDIDFISLLQRYASLDITTLKDYAHFYDYTKVIKYIQRHNDKPNVTYTFSRSEVNNSELPLALTLGANISVVFKGYLPKTHWGIEVIDGDAGDDVMIKHQGKVLGLLAKGDAKKDNSGFVVTPKTIENEI
jgi:hypothetical protein